METPEEIAIKRYGNPDLKGLSNREREKRCIQLACFVAGSHSAGEKQRSISVEFAQWSYGLKRIVNEDSFDFWMANIRNK